MSLFCPSGEIWTINSPFKGYVSLLSGVRNGIVRKDCLSEGTSVMYRRKSGIVRKERKRLDRGNMFLQNMRVCLQNYMASQPRSPQMFTTMKASKPVYKSRCFIKIMVFGNVTPWSVDRYQCFVEACSVFYPEYGGGRSL
jgi:hypothetical protein